MSGRRSARGTAGIRRSSPVARRGSAHPARLGRVQPDPVARPARDHPGRPRAVRRERERRVRLPPARRRRRRRSRPSRPSRPGSASSRCGQPVPAVDRRDGRPAAGAADRGRRVGRGRPARHAPGPARRAHSRSSSGRSARSASSSTPTGSSSPTPTASSDLPVIVDKRGRRRPASTDARATRRPRPAGARDVDIGDTIDPVDFDAATRLGSLRPVDVGSGAAALHVTIDDDHGFSRRHRADGLDARSSASTRRRSGTTDLIPGQVRLLRSLLAGREADDRHDHPGRRPRTGRTSDDDRAGRSSRRSRVAAGPPRRVALPKRSDRRATPRAPSPGRPRPGGPARAPPQGQRQLRVRPLLRPSRSSRRSTRSSARSAPSSTGSTTIGSSSAASSPTRSWPSCSRSSAIGSAWTCTSWP